MMNPSVNSYLFVDSVVRSKYLREFLILITVLKKIFSLTHSTNMQTYKHKEAEKNSKQKEKRIKDKTANLDLVSVTAAPPSSQLFI